MRRAQTAAKSQHSINIGVKFPFVQVLESLENFFQEVFKWGLGQRPKVLVPLPVRIAELNGAVEIAGENQL